MNADDVKIQGNVYLRKRFKCDGQLSLWYANIGHDLQIRDLDESEKMTLILRSATAGTFLDDTGSWPKKGNLFLDGFSYERIDSRAPMDAVNRIAWLHRQSEDKFLPQPYEQLASVLLKMGHERMAKAVIIQKNLDHGEYITRSYEGGPFWKKLSRLLSHEWWWYNVIGKAIGYGYRPGRAFLVSFMFVLLGWLLFRVGYVRDVITPKDAKAYEKDSRGQRVLVESYPRFNAFVYSLESFVPLIKFDQSENWAPNANRAGGRVLRYYLYLHIVAGWILTTLWVGAVTGLVKS